MENPERRFNRDDHSQRGGASIASGTTRKGHAVNASINAGSASSPLGREPLVKTPRMKWDVKWALPMKRCGSCHEHLTAWVFTPSDPFLPSPRRVCWRCMSKMQTIGVRVLK